MPRAVAAATSPLLLVDGDVEDESDDPAPLAPLPLREPARRPRGSSNGDASPINALRCEGLSSAGDAAEAPLLLVDDRDGIGNDWTLLALALEEERARGPRRPLSGEESSRSAPCHGGPLRAGAVAAPLLPPRDGDDDGVKRIDG